MDAGIGRVRVLVVGDSDVGKTSLVNLLCTGEVLKFPQRTIGCATNVKLTTFVPSQSSTSLGIGKNAAGRGHIGDESITITIGEPIGNAANVMALGSGAQANTSVPDAQNSGLAKEERAVEVLSSESPQDARSFFVEFWDVGGHRNNKPAREMFYQKLNGILLVYDLRNIKSYWNLRKWLAELVRNHRERPGGIEEREDAPLYHNSNHGSKSMSRRQAHNIPNQDTLDVGGSQLKLTSTNYYRQALGALPVLIVGNKLDMISARALKSVPNSMQDFGIESITFSARRMDADKLSPFLYRVIEHRYYPQLEKRHLHMTIPVQHHHLYRPQDLTLQRPGSSSSGILRVDYSVDPTPVETVLINHNREDGLEEAQVGGIGNANDEEDNDDYYV